MKKGNEHVGSSLDELLKAESVLEETRAIALKETLAWQIQQTNGEQASTASDIDLIDYH